MTNPDAKFRCQSGHDEFEAQKQMVSMTYEKENCQMALFPVPITPTEFRTTLLSHGWFKLGPFKVKIREPELIRAFKSQNGDAIIKIFVENEKVLCETLYGNEEIAHQMTTNCLSLDIDINQLQSLITKKSNYDWFIERGFGRYLRSPTLYEDCIKIISTANQNWSNTEKIIQFLIENYGYDVHG